MKRAFMLVAGRLRMAGCAWAAALAVALGMKHWSLIPLIPLAAGVAYLGQRRSAALRVSECDEGAGLLRSADRVRDYLVEPHMVREVRALGAEPLLYRRWEDAASAAMRTRWRWRRRLARVNSVTVLTSAGLIVVAAWQLGARPCAASRGTGGIVVTHRMSPCPHVDRVIVLEKGQIVAVGTHGELIRDSPLYRQMFSAQVMEG